MHVATLYGMSSRQRCGTKADSCVFFIRPRRGHPRDHLLSAGARTQFRRAQASARRASDDRPFPCLAAGRLAAGDGVVVPSPGTMDALDRQEGHPADGVTCHDWFFCTRKLTEEEQEEMAIG